MFESLSEKLQSVFDRLGRKGRLSEEDVELALREVRVALLVAAAPYRPAAVTQLQTLGKQVDVPVFHDPGKKPPELAQAAVKHAEQAGLSFVIIDTAGRLQINEELMRELESMKGKVEPDEILLVADAMTGQEAVRVAEGFNQHVPLTGVILTKLDSDARGGAALSLREVTGVPIKYVGTGEKLDALEQFHPDRLAQRILGMGDVLSLIERAQEHVDQEQAAKMQSRVVKGEFDLQDFLDQRVQLRKMAGGGGLTGLVELLPGVGKMMKDARQAGQAVDEKQFNRIEAIIQSMTLEERRRPDVIGGSRKRRIASGSGTSPSEINQLLAQFRQMQGLM